MKMKLELAEYQNLFNEAYTQITKDLIFDSLDSNIKSNDKYDIQENIPLINSLFCFFLIEFFNPKQNENINHINELIITYSIILNTKKKEQKNEIYQYKNLK